MTFGIGAFDAAQGNDGFVLDSIRPDNEQRVLVAKSNVADEVIVAKAVVGRRQKLHVSGSGRRRQVVHEQFDGRIGETDFWIPKNVGRCVRIARRPVDGKREFRH